MMKSIPRLQRWLVLLALLPLIISSIAIYFPTLTNIFTAYLRPPKHFVSIYTIIIFCFTAGIHFSCAMNAPVQRLRHYALALWPLVWIIMFYILGGMIGAIMLPLGMIMLLGNDLYFAQRHHTPHWWWQARLIITIVFSIVHIMPLFDFQVLGMLEYFRALF